MVHLVVEGLVYFGSDDNHIYALDADTGQFRWRYRTGGRVRTTPTVLDGVVFVGSDDGYSYALDAKTGDLRWRYEAGGQSMSRLAVGDGVVVGATHTLLNSYLYALDVRSGSLLWRIRSRLALGTYPVVERGLVYIETFVGGNRLYALDAATGAVLWQFRSSFEDKYSSGFRYGERNCLGCQGAVAGFQGDCVCSMRFRMVSSLRMQAVKATFFGLPAAQSRA